MDRHRRWLLVSGSVAALALAASALWDAPVLSQTCPGGDVSVPADAVHLAPSLVHHQNWVGFDQPATTDGEAWIYACVNGQVIGRRRVKQIEFDPTTGVGQVKILTRWVDLTWLSGELDQYRDPSRWTLVYTRAG